MTTTFETNAQSSATRAVRAMPPALREACSEVRRLMTEARRVGSAARHRIGLLVQTVIDDERKYGTAAVKLLGEAVGRNADTLYEYASVARRWKAEEFAALSSRRGMHGVPLTFAHFILLAKVTPAERCSMMVERCLRDGLSVRDLKALVQKRRPRGSTPAHDTTLRRALAASETLFDVLAPIEPIVKDVRSKPITPKLAAQLEALASRLRALRDACSSNGATIEDELRRVRETLDARTKSARKLAS